MRQDRHSALPADLKSERNLLTVYSDGPSRPWDPNERHWVKSRFRWEGKCRGERLELHSTGEEPLKQGGWGAGMNTAQPPQGIC